jgi:hypothetical protein
VLKTEALATLIRFREELYSSLGLRQDSLFELVDAALTASHRSTLVRLSLTAAFRRRWPSTCDALADGSIDVVTLPALARAVCSGDGRRDEAALGADVVPTQGLFKVAKRLPGWLFRRR